LLSAVLRHELHPFVTSGEISEGCVVLLTRYKLGKARRLNGDGLITCGPFILCILCGTHAYPRHILVANLETIRKSNRPDNTITFEPTPRAQTRARSVSRIHRTDERQLYDVQNSKKALSVTLMPAGRPRSKGSGSVLGPPTPPGTPTARTPDPASDRSPEKPQLAKRQRLLPPPNSDSASSGISTPKRASSQPHNVATPQIDDTLSAVTDTRARPDHDDAGVSPGHARHRPTFISPRLVSSNMSFLAATIQDNSDVPPISYSQTVTPTEHVLGHAASARPSASPSDTAP
jgi:hypothetical protein